MIPASKPGECRRPSRWIRGLAPALALVVATACGGIAALPSPRPLIVSSGARLTTDAERMREIYDWAYDQNLNIQQDPSFWIVSVPTEQDPYPWETLVLQGDTARFQYNRANLDIQTPYQFYAHFYLMREMGRLAEWLPEAADAEGYALERAIVKRMADTWLLNRAVFDAQPHGLMDELIYADQDGHLDAFLFTARPEEFAEEREAWVSENPGALDAYRSWFRTTFGGDPPGVRGGSGQ